MAYSTIPKGSLYMNTKLYTGNGTTDTPQTGVGFQPDWTWIKGRSVAFDNNVFDAVRGPTKRLITNSTNGETTANEMIKSFNSDGFTLGNDDGVNKNSDTFVAWNWKAGTGQGSSNTDGSINTTYTSVNTTSGFSINQYTGTGATATVGHGLGVAPDFMIIKKYSASGTQWTIYHKQLGPTKHILFTTGAEVTQANYWNDTAPTNLVWTMGNQGEINGSGTTNICYAFAEKKGYSKFGSYIGNGDTDGTFVYTGFLPEFIMIKRASATEDWEIVDNKRLGYNVANYDLRPNTNMAEANYTPMDILSNGFKFRSANASINSGGTYIYMAFAKNPFVAVSGSTAVPVTAR